MRKLLLMIGLCIGMVVKGQVKSEVVTGTDVLKGISYQGKVVQLVKFQDKTGSFIAFITQSVVRPQKVMMILNRLICTDMYTNYRPADRL